MILITFYTNAQLGGGSIASLNDLHIRQRQVIWFTPRQPEPCYKLNMMDHRDDTDASIYDKNRLLLPGIEAPFLGYAARNLVTTQSPSQFNTCYVKCTKKKCVN
jgi:hypothetical protein